MRTLKERPRLTGVLLYGAIAVLMAVAAFFLIFSGFAGYDDEGTLLVTLNSFVHGDVLYRDIYSPYGPFYYELFGGFFKATGIAIGTDVSRLIVIVVWVASSLLFGLAAERLSGRRLLGATATIVTFAALGVLTGEPMHPQGLATLLLGVITLIVVSGPPRRSLTVGIGLGVTVGALLLTKVNVGAFAIAALALAAVLAIEPLHRRRWLRWLVVAAFIVMPLALTTRTLREEWIRELIAIELFATLAILVAARGSEGPLWRSEEGADEWLTGAIAGFLGASTVILGVIFATGVPLADLYDGTIVQGARIADVFITPLTVPGVAVDWTIAGLAGAGIAIYLRGERDWRQSPWPGVLRVIAGLAIWFTISRSAPFSLNPPGNPLVLPLALAWIAVLAPTDEPPYRRFVRIFLPALALAETMQVYPVAGSQIGIASVTLVAVGAICIGDGITSLREWNGARAGDSLRAFGAIVTIAILAVGGKFLVDSILLTGSSRASAYHQEKKLDLPGASLMRLPPEQAEEYQGLVSLIESHHCNGLIGYPNLDSLYLWTGIEPPIESAPGAWVVVLEEDDQERVVESMESTTRPCAFSNNGLAESWARGNPPVGQPLYDYIFNEFETVATVGEFEFKLPKGR